MNSKRGIVLIVGKQENGVAVLKDALKKDYKLYVATGYEIVLEKIGKIHPEVIIIDDEFLDMDCYELVKKIKGCVVLKETAIIIVSMHADVVNQAKGLKIGVADYITKPFNSLIIKLRVDTQMRIIEQVKQIEEKTMLISIDDLTGVYNRRFFNTQIKREWERAIREGTYVSLLTLDIDSFGEYNNTYGHPQGDKLLKAIAAAMNKSVRPSDIVARHGGDEFNILLPNTEVSGALSVAERIRKSVENKKILTANLVTGVTVSIGLCTCKPTKSGSIKKFTNQADGALYAAKVEGNNRVVVYDKKHVEPFVKQMLKAGEGSIFAK